MTRLLIELEGFARVLTFADLQSLPGQIARPTALFGGAELGAVPVSALLKAFRRPRKAQFVTFRSDDGFATCLPLDALDGVVLVYRLGMGALPAGQGGPLRLVVTHEPERSVKRVASVRFSEERLEDVRPSHRDDQAA
jgi:DMSO/TMAO reductase YedYZ molybdopterin-dependent catalytic subunit